MAVLRQTVLIRRAPAGEIDVIDLGDEALKGPRCYPDLAPIVGTSGRVDVEAGQDLADRLVHSKNNLFHLSMPRSTKRAKNPQG